MITAEGLVAVEFVGTLALVWSWSPRPASYATCAVRLGAFSFDLPLVVPATLWCSVSSLLPCVKGLANPVYYNTIDQKIVRRF